MTDLIAPTFTLTLGQPVVAGLLAVGRFDDLGTSLACATTGGRVFLHTGGASAGRAGAVGGVRFLNANKQVNALACGKLPVQQSREWSGTQPSPSAESSGAVGNPNAKEASQQQHDVLLIGTGGSLQAYDVSSNRDIFFKDTPEAVTAAVAGPWPLPSGASSPAGSVAGSNTTLCFAGGNCTLTGFDVAGNEAVWGVTGDVVTALCFADVDGDGNDELIVGTADADIRVVKGGDLDTVGEAAEGDAVTCLADISCSLATMVSSGATLAPASSKVGAAQQQQRQRTWAYGLANGAVGVYACAGSGAATAPGAVSGSGSGAASGGTASRPGSGAVHSSSNTVKLTRLWRLKAKGKTVSVASFDFDKDGQPEVACGWSSGRLEIRRANSGELLFRDFFPTGLAGLAVADYREDGRSVLLAVSVDGEVRAYPQVDAATLAAHRKAAGLTAAASAKPLPPSLSSSAATTAAGSSTGSKSAPSASTPAVSRSEIDEDTELQALISEKAALEAELRALQSGAATTGVDAATAAAIAAGTAVSLPAGSDVHVALAFNLAAKRLELLVTAVSPSSWPEHPGSPRLQGASRPTLTAAAALAASQSQASVPKPSQTLSIRAAAAFAPDSPVFPAGRESVLTVPPLAGGAAATAGAGGPAAVAANVRDTPVLSLPIAPAQNVAADLRVLALVGERASASVFAGIEKGIRLPKFSMFMLLPSNSSSGPSGPVPAAAPSTTTVPGLAQSGLPLAPSPLPRPEHVPQIPSGTVSFELPERAARVVMWASSAFPVVDGTVQVHPSAVSSSSSPPGTGGDGDGSSGRPGSAPSGAPPPGLFDGSPCNPPLALDLRFACVRDGGRSMLRIAVSGENGGQSVIQCDDMEVCGAVLQVGDGAMLEDLPCRSVWSWLSRLAPSPAASPPFPPLLTPCISSLRCRTCALSSASRTSTQ